MELIEMIIFSASFFPGKSLRDTNQTWHKSKSVYVTQPDVNVINTEQ